MTNFVDAHLVNGSMGDPCLRLRFRSGRAPILFDLGDLGALDASLLQSVGEVFVSHAHVDHFIGFDRLLRFRLGHPGRLTLYGPGGFARHVAARLGGYTWNLLDETSPDFIVEVVDVEPRRAVRFRARRRFEAEAFDPPSRPAGLILEDPDFTISAVALDHGIPSLAFALQERPRLKVDMTAMARLGLAPGPWINRAKEALRAEADAALVIPVGADQVIDLGALSGTVLRRSPGQKIAYVTDAADHPDNEARIIALAAGADQLFIETVFANEDAAQALARHHLTAGAAGRLARLAGVRAVVPMHLSPRYAADPRRIIAQCEAAFAARERSTEPD